MIIKERDKQEHPESDRLAVAGARAEEQMAFYLRRAFDKSQDILVINDLRLKDHTNDVTQIDHFIIHTYGMIIIESKSVTSEVRINKNGEWTRVWNRQEQGMPSPIQQAKRQAEFLKKNLQDHAAQLLDKILIGLLQKRFGTCPFDTIIAISDSGIVKRDSPAAEVIKADQVSDRVKEIIAAYKKTDSLLDTSRDTFCYTLKPTEMQKIADFLISCHSPLKVTEPKPCPMVTLIEADPDAKYKPKPIASVDSIREPAADDKYKPNGHGGVLCAKCNRPMEILWGKYGYYWKCQPCNANLAIKEFCPTCKKKLLLHKKANQYTLSCEPCKTDKLYYLA